MKIRKIKELIVRLILNNPEFRISENTVNETSSETDSKRNSVPEKQNSDKPDSNSTSDNSSSEKANNKRDHNYRTARFRRDLGIFVFVLFLLYVANNYLVSLHHSKNIEYSISFSEIDSVAAEYSLMVNINTADEEELIKLPGIGKNKAHAIIEYRTDNEGFSNIEEIMNVKGIGEKIFEQIKSNITV